MSKTILNVANLTKIYGREYKIAGKQFGRRVEANKKVTFSINKGEIFGFLGPNGSGKTTTIRSILGYLKLQSGSITVLGMDHKKDAMKIRRNIAYVPGDVSLYENFTGHELINFFNKFRPLNPEFLKEMQTIFKVDLTLKIGALSKGNRQQVALISAMASKPDFLIMDEPTSGLDPLMESRFHTLIKKLKKEGMTIFLSSHDLAEVQAVCDRIAIIKEGEIIIVERVEELKEKSLQKATIQFAGEIPELEDFSELKNILDVEKVNGKTYTLKVKEDVNELLTFLNKYQIKRMTLEDASLTEIFLQFYE